MTRKFVEEAIIVFFTQLDIDNRLKGGVLTLNESLDEAKVFSLSLQRHLQHRGPIRLEMQSCILSMKHFEGKGVAIKFVQTRVSQMNGHVSKLAIETNSAFCESSIRKQKPI